MHAEGVSWIAHIGSLSHPPFWRNHLGPIAFAILVLTSVAVVGLLIGSIRLRGIGLGPAGVLFAGILFGHFGVVIEPEIAEFAKEFGLVLFVFMIGLQLGPGIVRLWKQNGLTLNLLAVAIVLQGLGIIAAFHAWLDLSPFAAAGLFSGATTNTPSLGAASQAVAILESDSAAGIEVLSAAYAVAYPGGIVGIILSMMIIRRMFRVNVNTEAEQLKKQDKAGYESIQRRSLVVKNAQISGIPFGQIPGLEETGVRISRVRRAGQEEVQVATDETTLCKDDIILVIGTPSGLDRFAPLIGHRSEVDLMKSTGNIEFRRVVVTEPKVLNTPLRDLSLDHFFNASVTRIRRSGIEMTAKGSSRFHFGDIAHIVGEKSSLDDVARLLGNSSKSLNETQFTPLFLGIAIGVIVGMIPIPIPGVPFPVRLGLAGGPLVAAILFSLVGRVGEFVWYIPYSANLALRELGIILFLACAGLGAGQTFFDVVMTAEGVIWMLIGFVVTTVPLLTTGIFARLVAKQNYLTICGVIAGSMTDPPALAFANSLADSDACSTSYAAVYPLTMVLRIVSAQAIIYLLLRG